MKSFLKLIPSIIFIFLLTACAKKQSEKVISLNSSTLDLGVIADKIMEKANPQVGEKIFMIGQPGEFDSLIVLLKERIEKAGAVYMGTLNVDTVSWPESFRTDFVKSTEGKTNDELVKIFDTLDLGIMLPEAAPFHHPYAAWQEVMKQRKGRAIHFHWTGVSDLMGRSVPVDSSMNILYQRAVLNTDYAALSKIQSEFEKAIRNEVVAITTPGGKLSFQVGDRPVTKQDGDASRARSLNARNLIDREIEIPAGAIRVAPLEETVEGTIAFPNSYWNDQRVEGLVVTFKKGKITEVKARIGLDFIKSRLEIGKENYLLREFALGFNPLLELAGNPFIPYYGYGAGIVRISFGNNEELGGIVGGDFVRINLITDATVMVGKDIWVKDGKLLK